MLFVAFGGSLADTALFGEEWVHLLLLVLVPGIAVWSLVPSLARHGRKLPLALAFAGVPLLALAVVVGGAAEAPLSIAGGLAMITAHTLNRRFLRATSTD